MRECGAHKVQLLRSYISGTLDNRHSSTTGKTVPIYRSHRYTVPGLNHTRDIILYIIYTSETIACGVWVCVCVRERERERKGRWVAVGGWVVVNTYI